MARAARLSSRVDVLLFVGCLILSLVALALPAQMREPLAESLRRSVVAPLIGLQSSAERWRTAWQLSDERTARLDSAVMRNFSVVALQTENDQLRELLGLGARLRAGFVPAEAVHNAVREDVITTLTLTAGSRAGVKVYSPVVAPEGLVGMVQTVDPTISIAILFSHPDFRASAMSGDGSSFGIVYPHLEDRIGGGASRYLLELRGVPFRTTLKPGTLIYTSGLGGTYPRGIPIGMVLREGKTSEGWTRTYLLQPSVNLARVTSVMVLTPHRTPQRLDNVWQMVASVDSATRHIVEAADSISRQETRDSLRRIQAAAADSARAHADTGTAPVIAAPPVARDSTLPRQPAARTAPAPARRDSTARRDSISRRDSTRRDSLRRDSARRDSARRDSARRDSARRDTTRRDTTRRDTTPRAVLRPAAGADSSRARPDTTLRPR